MLMSAVVDPTVFSEHYFVNSSYRMNVELFFEDIIRGGCLVVDSEGYLENKLLSSINSLSLKFRQKILILFEEIRKNKRRKIIKSKVKISSNITEKNLIDSICRVKKFGDVDSLVVSDDSSKLLCLYVSLSDDIFPLSRYFDSKFRKQISFYREELPPIDKMDRSKIEDLIIGIIKYAKWIRIYDGIIGKGNNTSHFYRGIKFILNICKERGHFADSIEFIEVITCSDKNPNVSPEENRKNYGKNTDELIAKLQSSFPWKINFKVVDDQDGIFHARYLETNLAIISFERGFDLFKPDGKTVKRNIIKIDNGRYEHLKECRNLREVTFLT